MSTYIASTGLCILHYPVKTNQAGVGEFEVCVKLLWAPPWKLTHIYRTPILTCILVAVWWNVHRCSTIVHFYSVLWGILLVAAEYFLYNKPIEGQYFWKRLCAIIATLAQSCLVCPHRWSATTICMVNCILLYLLCYWYLGRLHRCFHHCVVTVCKNVWILLNITLFMKGT